MTRRSASTDPRAERVRERMKQAALSLIHERRVETISVKDVVERAGVSRPAFYQHFSDRDDAVSGAVADALAARVDPEMPPRAVIDALAGFAAENVDLYRNLYPSVASQRAVTAFRVLMRPACSALVDELWASSPVAASRESLTTFLLGGLMETMLDWAEMPGGDRPEVRTAQLLDAFRALLVSPAG